MSWILPTPAAVLARIHRNGSGARRPPSYFRQRHRPGYFRDYHAKNAETRRPYLARKKREYRAARRIT